MAIKAFRRPGQMTTETVLLAANIEDFTRQLVLNPLLDGRVISTIALTASVPSTIPHSLGRDWLGWLVINKNANANVWVSATTNKDRGITLTASANVTIDLYIF